MKKILLTLSIVILCGVGYYFLRINNISKSVYSSEKENVNSFIDKIRQPLNMLIISNSIDNRIDSKNLIDKESYKQQFVMEYYLSNIKKYDSFITVNQMGEIDNEVFPTEEMAISYLKYEEFNKYYKLLFGKDFDKKNKELSGYEKYDNGDYVYYSNRRPGSNGKGIISYDIDSIIKHKDEYKAKLKLKYSDSLNEEIKKNTLVMNYKYKNKNIIIKEIQLTN